MVWLVKTRTDGPSTPAKVAALMSLADLIAERRIVVCVGSGGVGKTTVAATLGLAGAGAGRRTLVLTIDPAKRLANALGLATLSHEETQVPPEKVAEVAAALGRAPGNTDPPLGTLTAMMLDQKRAFDEIVERYAPDPATRERIYKNRIYQQISATLAGSHEYAAMAKLQELAASGRYDLLVLDTPPTTNALDFLDAPERVAQAIDSPAIQWFVKPASGAGRFSLKSLGLGATFVVGRLARFVGAEFLDDVAEFVVEFNSILGGFRQRAEETFALLRNPDVAFVMVSSAEPLSVDEAFYFHQRLVEGRMPVGAFVVNRVHPKGVPLPSRGELVARLEARPELTGFAGDDVVQFAADLERTAKEGATLGAQDALQLARLDKIAAGAPVVAVPFFDGDVYDVAGLSQMAKALVGVAAATAR